MKVVLYGLYNNIVIQMFKEKLGDSFTVAVEENEARLDSLYNADYIVNRVFYMPPKVFDASPQLKMVAKWGAGYDKVDVRYAAEKKIPVLNCVGINAIPVAELAVLLMLSVYRHILPQANRFKEGEWPRDEYASRSYLLSGKTVGLLGFGRIGQEVAHIVHDGFGAKIMYHDISRARTEKEMELGAEYCEMNQLLSCSDIVSIHLPLLESTTGLIDKSCFEQMKPTSILINTARGGIVCEEDLVDALSTGKIMGAGLDTYENEPLPPTSRLFSLENVVLTPHIAGNTADNDEKMVDCCVRHILSHARGEELEKTAFVNKQFFATT